MDEIHLTKEKSKTAKEVRMVNVDDSTLTWMHQHLEYEPHAWYVRKTDEGSMDFDSPGAAEKAAEKMAAEFEKKGFERYVPRAPQAATAAKKSALAKPAWLAKLPAPLDKWHKEYARTAKKKGLDARWDEIEPLLRPGVDLVLKKAKPADLKTGVISRIGGEPDLPARHEWPKGLTFVAQIVISPEIKALDLEGILPASGVLSFFATLDGKKCRVFHFAKTGLARTKPPEPSLVLAEAGVFTPKGRLTVAPTQIPAAVAMQLNDDEQDAYTDDLFMGPIPEGRHHMVLGWPTRATKLDVDGKRFFAQLDSDHRIKLEMGKQYDALRFYVDGDKKVDAKSLETAVCTLARLD
jgi:hypothetical protein